jgi:2-dehydropantoate 2-reductase
MRIAVLGSGAVGGYYGAKLAQAGHEVTFIARGAHLRAIRERGLLIFSPRGDLLVHAPAEDDPARVGVVDLVIIAIKTYDNGTALPMVRSMVGPDTTVLTLQNGVDSVGEVAAIVGEGAVLGGATYIATGVAGPGLIEQTGTHQRIVFGEVFGLASRISDRVRRIAEALTGAGIDVEPVPDARVPLWEKFIYLAPFAAFTGAARLPIGPLWADPFIRGRFLEAIDEVAAVALAEQVAVPAGVRDRIIEYMNDLPPATRSSLLIDLAAGKRIEVEALQGSVVRRGAARGVPTPTMAGLYAALKPHASGRV